MAPETQKLPRAAFAVLALLASLLAASVVASWPHPAHSVTASARP
jgi:hypothetical protein